MTVLGSRGGVDAAAIVSYLEHGAGGVPLVASDGGVSAGGVGRYFADSGAGRWLGPDVPAVPVDPAVLEALLSGRDPASGVVLKSAQGSHLRAAGRSGDASSTHQGRTRDASSHWLTASEAAERLGVDASYVRAQARATAAHAAAPLSDEAPVSPLFGVQVGRRWLFDPAEVERFGAGRRPARVVHGFDVTFSVPKSVSLLWAVSDDATRQRIETVIDNAVEVGVGYLAEHGFWFRDRQVPQKAVGFRAAGYRHHTSRALEPQLHDHVVIPNLATAPDGRVRSLDGRGVFAHAPTARHLAAAELRRGLTRELGVEWGPVRNGIADIEGIPTEALAEMSSRRHAVLDHAEAFGLHTHQGRRTAALATRAAKDLGVDWGQLEDSWRHRLAGHGLTRTTALDLTEPRLPRPFRVSEEAAVLRRAARLDGVTETGHVFDRRRVIEWLADDIGHRVGADRILRLADRFLEHHGIPLEPDPLGHTRYTTTEAVALERRVIDLHAYGHNRSTVTVATERMTSAITTLEARLGHPLGADQAEAVRRLTGSGDQFQALIGLAGSGKTTVLAAAADAWTAEGYRVIAAAPFGAAARQLEASIGIEAHTLEGLLTGWRHDQPGSRIDNRTVVIVDEASTISNRQLDQLYRHIHNTGAALRTVGDPHQHQSVDAGGLWNQLTHTYPEQTPRLVENRRQNPEALSDLRSALDQFRAGDTRTAIQQLDADGRITSAERWDELLDQLVDTWHHHRTTALETGEPVPSMIAERNRDRRDLNQRAQTLLRNNGELGTPVRIGVEDFHLGETVVTQAPNRTVLVDGRPLVNGAFGTITAIDPDTVTVDLEHGTAHLPRSWVAEPVGSGRGGGLTPAHAITSYKAQGRTFQAALGLAAPGVTNRPGLYVTLTRGTHHLELFTTHREQDTELPAIPDDRTPDARLADHLKHHAPPPLATQLHPSSPGRDVDAMPLHVLLEQHRTSRLGTDTDRRIRASLHRRIDQAVTNPAPYLTNHLGPRPTNPGPEQSRWDAEARRIETRRHHHGLAPQHGPQPGTTTLQQAVGAERSARISRLQGQHHGPTRDR